MGPPGEEVRVTLQRMRMAGVDFARTVVPAVRDVLFPLRCLGCGSFGSLLCAGCEAGLEASRVGTDGRCRNCAATWDRETFCPRCEWWGWDSIDDCRAAFDMDGLPRRMVHSLKYIGTREVAPIMARLMARTPDSLTFDGAVAVPLHPSRMRERGFNQAELLLRALDWPRAPGSLSRVRKTGHQVGQGQSNRRLQVLEAFRYEGPSLTGQRILLVDDVVTSGATARECAMELKAAGARSVHVVAFARASFKDQDFVADRALRD